MATFRQHLTAQKILENPGKSVSQAMREAGYSESTAHNPGDLTQSLGWQKLMDTYLPDSKVLEKLSENIDNPSGFVSNSALSIAFKLKGKYERERFAVVDEFDNWTDEELFAEMNQLEENIKRKKQAIVTSNFQESSEPIL